MKSVENYSRFFHLLAQSFCRNSLLIISHDDSIDSELEALKWGADIFLSKRDDPRLIAGYLDSLTRAKLITTPSGGRDAHS
jgi:hypothetical protein